MIIKDDTRAYTSKLDESELERISLSLKTETLVFLEFVSLVGE